MAQKHIAVIGAGLAGLACAQALARADVRVTVFEKSRALGGRLATRHVAPFAFDHGAQYVTARGAAFREYLDHAHRGGQAGIWTPIIRNGDALAPTEAWHVGLPGMRALVRPLARGLEIEHATNIVELRRDAAGWQLETGGGRDARHFDAVMVAVPTPQALALLEASATLCDALAGVRLAPTWCAMAAYDAATRIAPDVLTAAGPVIAWASRDSSKPGRTRRAECWVVHATAEWSEQHLADEPAQVTSALLQDLSQLAECELTTPGIVLAHRWRYARVETAAGRACVFDPSLALGYCGDGCLAPRAEAAFDSGRALAAAVIDHYALPRPLPPLP